MGIKLSRADQEWNVNVVQAPITEDSSGQSFVSYSYYKKIPNTQQNNIQNSANTTANNLTRKKESSKSSQG